MSVDTGKRRTSDEVVESQRCTPNFGADQGVESSDNHAPMNAEAVIVAASSLPTSDRKPKADHGWFTSQGEKSASLMQKVLPRYHRPLRRGRVSLSIDNEDAMDGRQQTKRREQLKKERPGEHRHRGRWMIGNSPTTFRHWLIYHLESQHFGIFYYWFNGVLDIMFLILYMIERALWTPVFAPYILLTPRPFPLWVLVIAFSYVAVALFFLRLYTTLEWRMIISPYFAIDLMTSFPFILSTFFISGRFWYVPYFLRCWTAFHYFRQFVRIRTQLTEGYSYDQLRERIFVLITVVLCIFFSAVASINYVENAFGDGTLNFFRSFYLIVITASTVGYGDIVPETLPGQIVIILFIVIAIAVLPTQIASLVDATRLHRAGGGRHIQYRGRHVIITGALCNDTHVLDYLNEFFHDETLRNTYKVVLLSTTELSSAIALILNSPFFRSRVTYLIGSPLSTYDLKRANAAKASAVFVLSDKFTSSLKDADAQNILRVWALQNAVDPQRLYISNVYPDSGVYLKFTDKVIYMDELGKALLALNARHRGSSTFILNLLHSYTPPTVANNIWEGEYGDGASTEVYMTALPTAFLGMPMNVAAWMLFEYFQVTLIAVRVYPDGKEGDSVFLLNPASAHCLQASDECFFLAQDRQDMRDISAFTQTQHPNFDALKEQHLATHRKVQEQEEQSETRAVRPPVAWDVGDLEKTHSATSLATVSKVSESVTSSPSSSSSLSLASSREATVSQGGTGGGFHSSSLTGLNAHSLASEWKPPPGGDRWVAHAGYPEAPSKGTVVRSWILAHPRTLKESLIEETQFLYRQPFILLLAEHLDVFTLVQQLRLSSIPRDALRPIVMMGKETPTSSQWSSLGVFPEVYFMQGWLTRERSLLRAGLMQAETVMMVTHHRVTEDAMMVDYHPILLYEKIHSLRANCPLVCELHSRKNLPFAYPRTVKHEEDARFIFSPAFASGHVIALSMIDSVLFRAFQSPFLLSVLKHLLVLNDEAHDAKMTALGYRQATYQSMAMPERFVGGTFGSLFHAMALYEGKIPVAIYRACLHRERGNQSPYIYTNPLADTVLDADDRIHFIA